MIVHQVQSAYEQLVGEIQTLHGAKPDQAMRIRIGKAADGLTAAIRSDGGARRPIMQDAEAIRKGLADGSFDAKRSLAALRNDADRMVLKVGPWHPEILRGTAVSQPVGASFHQTGSGDCVGVSVLKAFSATRIGAEILEGAVRQDSGGDYNVSLPGDASRIYYFGADEVAKLGKGDPAAAAIIAALYKYFGLDPRNSALPTNKVMELLAGDRGTHRRLADREASAADIEDFLRAQAPRVGHDVAMVFGGRPAHGGVYTRGDGHAFAVLQIDADRNIVRYVNPWNVEDVHTIPIDELASAAAGTSADFETVSFDPR